MAEPDITTMSNLTRTLTTEALGKLFPKSAIKRREGRGRRTFEYIEGSTVIHRLIEATGNQWDFRLTRLEKHGDLLMAVGELTIPGLGTRTGIGVQVVDEKAGEDIWKGVGTDALKKAATLFGVALELYAPDYEADLAAVTESPPTPVTTPAKPPTPPPPAPSRNGTNVIDEAFGPPMPVPAKAAQKADARRVTPDQVTELADLIRETETDPAAFKKYFKVAELDNLTEPDYWRAKKLLQDKLDQSRAKALDANKPAGAAALGGAK